MIIMAFQITCFVMCFLSSIIFILLVFYNLSNLINFLTISLAFTIKIVKKIVKNS